MVTTIERPIRRKAKRNLVSTRWGLSPRELHALEHVRARLRAILPNGEIKSLILYGSKARGDSHRDSDIDLFLVVDDVTPEQKQSVEEYTTDLIIETPRVHVMTFDPNRLAEQASGLGHLLLYNVARQGIVLEGVPMPKFEIDRREVAKAGIAEARDKLVTAQYLLSGGMYKDAVSRAYYAVLYAADAALATKGLVAKSHAGTNSLFGYHFLRKGLVDAKFKGLFKQIEKARIEADYSHMIKFTRDDAEHWLGRAREFVAAIEAGLPLWLEQEK